MDLQFSKEDEAFRSEVRNWLEENLWDMIERLEEEELQEILIDTEEEDNDDMLINDDY